MSRLTGLTAVYWREFRAYFSSPLGYVFIVIFLVASGFLTLSRDFGRILELRQADLAPFFNYLPWLFVVLVPAVAMRLWSEERKTGTVELLLTLPVTLEGAYLGKFLAGLTFLTLSLMLTWPVIFQVARLGDPDWGAIFGGHLASVLTAGAFLAVGMLFSALTKNQVVAFILGVAVSALFLLLGLPQTLEMLGRVFGGFVEKLFSGLSLIDHFETLSRGLLEVLSLWFFALFTLGWLLSGMLVLDRTRAA